jgi:hypothetical protein
MTRYQKRKHTEGRPANLQQMRELLNRRIEHYAKLAEKELPLKCPKYLRIDQVSDVEVAGGNG